MFIMLFAHSRDKMIEYLHSVLDQVESFGEMIQLIIIEVCFTFFPKAKEFR